MEVHKWFYMVFCLTEVTMHLSTTCQSTTVDLQPWTCECIFGAKKPTFMKQELSLHEGPAIPGVSVGLRQSAPPGCALHGQGLGCGGGSCDFEVFGLPKQKSRRGLEAFILVPLRSKAFAASVQEVILAVLKRPKPVCLFFSKGPQNRQP